MMQTKHLYSLIGALVSDVNEQVGKIIINASKFFVQFLSITHFA